jgi:Predicted Zn-dependent hydrolases of the beta-lactamase fold
MHAIEAATVNPGSVAIHWFEQSSYALKDAKGTIVMIDPYFPRQRPPEKYIHAEPPVDEAEVRTDWVLLTHNHSDHTCIESLLRIRDAWPKARFAGPVESVQAMVEAGIPQERTITVRAGDRLELDGLQVAAVYAKPPEGDPERGIAPPDVTHLGYVIDAGGVRVYVSGDPINTFAERDDLIRPIAELKPHIGFLTTHPTEGEFPFFDGSVAMATKIGLVTAVPAHYDCFVKRNYDPHEWSAAFPSDRPERLIIPRNSTVVYTPPEATA